MAHQASAGRAILAAVPPPANPSQVAVLPALGGRDAREHFNPQARVCIDCGVRRFALFGVLDDEALERIHYRIADVSLEPGQHLYSADMRGMAAFTIREGVIDTPDVRHARIDMPALMLALHDRRRRHRRIAHRFGHGRRSSRPRFARRPVRALGQIGDRRHCMQCAACLLRRIATGLLAQARGSTAVRSSRRLESWHTPQRLAQGQGRKPPVWVRRPARRQGWRTATTGPARTVAAGGQAGQQCGTGQQAQQRPGSGGAANRQAWADGHAGALGRIRAAQGHGVLQLSGVDLVLHAPPPAAGSIGSPVGASNFV